MHDRLPIYRVKEEAQKSHLQRRNSNTTSLSQSILLQPTQNLRAMPFAPFPYYRSQRGLPHELRYFTSPLPPPKDPHQIPFINAHSAPSQSLTAG